MMYATVLLIATLVPADLPDLFAETSHDFGAVPRGQTPTHEFVLTNSTRSTIRLSGVSTSCHCAEPRILDGTAEPGDTATVQVMYDTRKFTGPRSMTITVRFAEPYGRQVTLRVSGQSRADITISPSVLDFGIVGPNAETTREATLACSSNRTWRVGEVLPSESFAVELEEVERRLGRVAYKATVRLTDERASGPIEETIRFRTNDPNAPLVQLVARATVRGPLTASPERLDLGNIALGDSKKFKVMLKGDTPFKLTAFRGDPEGVRILAMPDARKLHVITLEVTPTAEGTLDREYTFVSDQQDAPTVRLVGDVGPAEPTLADKEEAGETQSTSAETEEVGGP